MAGTRATISMNVEGADSSRRQIETVGDAFRELDRTTLNRLGGEVTSIGAGLGALKGAIIGAAVGFASISSVVTFAGWIKGAADAADSLGDLSKSTGVAIEDLAGLRLAAEQSGSDLTGVAETLNKLSMNIAKDGEKFSALGITAKEPLEAFQQLSDVFSAIQDPQTRAALGAFALGESWAKAAPLLAEGGDRIGEMVAKGKELSGMTAAMVEESDRFNDSMAELSTTMEGFKTKIASDMLPGLNGAIGAIQTAYTESGKLQAAWVALGAVGSFLFTDEFSSAQVKIANLKDDLADWEASLALSENTPGFGAVGRWIWGESPEMLKANIASAKAQIKALQDQLDPPTAFVDTFGDRFMASVEAYRVQGVLNSKQEDEVAKKRAAAAKAAAAELKREAIAQAGLVAELSGLTSTFASDWGALEKIYRKGTISVEQLTKAQADLLAKQPGIKAAADDELAYRKALTEAAAGYTAAYEAASDSTAKAFANLQAQRDENEQIGLSAVQLAELNAVRLESKALRAEENALIAEGLDLTGELAEKYYAEAKALRELADEQRKGAQKKMASDEARAAADAWDRASNDINKSLTDALMRGFESGKGFGKNLVDTIENLFSTLVLRPVIQAVMQPMSDQISSFTGGGSGTGQQVAGGIRSLSSLFGTTTASKGVAGGASSALGGVASYGGWIAAGMALADGLYKKGWDPNNGTVSKGMIYTEPLTGSSTILNEAFKALGMNNKAANLFSGASITSALFGRKNPEIESQGIRGTFGGSGFSGDAYANIVEKGGLFRSTKRYEQSAVLSAAQDSSFDAMFKALTDATKGFASTLGIEASVIDGYNKQIKLQLGADEAKNQEAIANLFGEISDELSMRLMPSLSSFTQAGETASTTLQRLAIDYATVDQALTSIGMQFGSVGVASIGTRERLLEASGGLDLFATNIAGFQQNFLTEAERNAPVLKSVTEQLAAMGLAWVDTREELKAEVLALDPTTQGDRLASLLKLQAAFAQVYPAIDQTTTAAAKLAEANRPFLDQIGQLERSLMSVSERRAVEIMGMDASTVALYDRVAALNSEVEARDKAMALAQIAADERANLQNELDSLTMTAAQLLEKQRNALQESNRALFDQVQAAKAHADATQQASQVIRAAQEAAAASMRSFGDSVVAAMDRATASAKSMRDFSDSLLLGSLSTLDPDAKYREAKKQFEAADPSDTQAAQAFLQASKDRGADSFYYNQDFMAVQMKLAKGAADAEAYAARLPDFYRGYVAMLSSPAVVPTPAAPVSAQQSRFEAQSNTKVLADRLDTVIEKLGAVASQTGQFAEQFDRVSNGGNQLVVKD